MTIQPRSSHPALPNPYEETLPALLRQVFGARTRITAVATEKLDRDYAILILTLSSPVQRVVVKLAGPQAPLLCPFDRTAALERRVAAETSIPTPQTYAQDVSYRDWPWRYVIKEYLTGVQWAQVFAGQPRHALDLAYRDLGEAVAQLLCIRFAAFGEVTAAGEVENPSSLIPALERRAAAFIHDPEQQLFFRRVLAARRDLFAELPAPGVAHEDLHKYNLLLRQVQGEWRLAAILDFDKAWAGPPESDLARLELWRGMTNAAFWEGYTRICRVQEGYAERRSLYQLFWCLEYGDASAQHLEDTRLVCAQLGISPPNTVA